MAAPRRYRHSACCEASSQSQKSKLSVKLLTFSLDLRLTHQALSFELQLCTFAKAITAYVIKARTLRGDSQIWLSRRLSGLPGQCCVRSVSDLRIHTYKAIKEVMEPVSWKRRVATISAQLLGTGQQPQVMSHAECGNPQRHPQNKRGLSGGLAATGRIALAGERRIFGMSGRRAGRTKNL